MYRRFFYFCLLVLLIASLSACHSKKVQNPIAQVDSKQPDKVLFDRAMEAMNQRKYDTARITLQTLINTYPDSEYLARAKMALGDSWVAEKGEAADTQAEREYNDFITFFPDSPEAAEAQMKIANLHFQLMDKPDRDYTHLKRAEEEYRKLITNYPDSNLVPEAKLRLLEVQEALADREFLIGRFYYLRQSWPAAIARLKSVADSYPLFSGADDALLMLGQAYEQQAQMVRATKPPAGQDVQGWREKQDRLVQDELAQAAGAYSRLVKRYPVSPRANEAKKRLVALHVPVPTPTPEAIEQNKAEIASRGLPTGHFGRVWGNFHKRPDTATATKVGEPSMTDPQQTNAADIVRDSFLIMNGEGAKGTQTVSAEAVPNGAPPPSDPTPRSDSANKAPGANAVSQLTPGTSSAANSSGSDPNAGPAPAPPQINDAQASDPNAASDAANSGKTQDSTSQPNKKKGLRKIVPF